MVFGWGGGGGVGSHNMIAGSRERESETPELHGPSVFVPVAHRPKKVFCWKCVVDVYPDWFIGLVSS